MFFLIKLMDTWASLSAHYLNILSNFESNATRVINQMWWNNPLTTGAQKICSDKSSKKAPKSSPQFLSFSPCFFEICHFFLPEIWENSGRTAGSARRSLLPGTRSTAVVTTEPCQLVFCFAWRSFKTHCVHMPSNMHWWIDIIYIYTYICVCVYLCIYLLLNLFICYIYSYIYTYMCMRVYMPIICL